MSALTNIIKELRERKLWPIAIGLVVALVAVPVLLSKSAPTNLVTHAPTGGLPYSTGTALPAITVETKAGTAKLAGRGRDPFTPQHGATTTTTASAVVTTASAAPAVSPSASSPASSGGASSPAGVSAGSAGGGSASPSPAASSPAPAPSAPASTPAAKPGPTGLTATQSYQVKLAITTSDGGVNTIDSLERLSVLPSLQQPLLVELGVLQGGRDVLFAVERGAAVSGPAACTPGPIDCEVISLAPGQVEAVSQQTPAGTTVVAQFSVDSVTAAQHSSAAAANQARRAASEAGRQLLAGSPLSATSLFQYDPSVGAVVDLRNLTVGGS